MKNHFRFSLRYFLLVLLLLGTEICIALFVHDSFVRPYIGDLLAVIFVYCGVRSVLRITPSAAAVGALLFAYTLEIMQYFHLVKLLGLENSQFARILLGTSFAWEDMIAYTAGALLVLLIERSPVRHAAARSH
ncbi:MAG: DUF2809 domain-containing protein [Chitinophagaceae bacterium]|nr:DUF2809 domain-containing protein [Chitinophagaceae bacterium]